MMRNRLAMVAILSMTIALLSMTTHAGEPGEGIDIGRLLLRPYVSVDAAYDSNPQLSAEEEDDYYIEGELGVDLTLPTKLFLLDGALFVSRRDYIQEDAQEDLRASQTDVGDRGSDATDFGEMLGLRIGDRSSLLLSIRQSFQRAQDYSRQPSSESLLPEYDTDAFVAEDRADRAQRDLLNAAVTLGRDVTDKVEADIGYGYRQTDYDDEELFDHLQHSVECELSYGITDKSAVFAMGRYRVLDTDALPDDEDTSVFHVGWKTRFTVKTTVKAGVGVEHAPSEDELSFDLVWEWQPTEKLAVSVTGEKSIEPSAYDRGYTRDLLKAELSAAYLITEALDSSIGVSYRGEEANPTETVAALPQAGPQAGLGPVPNARESDIYGVRAGVGFAATDWLRLSLKVSHESTDSNYFGGDYDETRVILGGRATY
jgi:hypothetical protein